MKVRELIRKLKDCNPENEVLIRVEYERTGDFVMHDYVEQCFWPKANASDFANPSTPAFSNVTVIIAAQ